MKHLDVSVVLSCNAVPRRADVEKQPVRGIKPAVLESQHVPWGRSNKPKHDIARCRVMGAVQEGLVGRMGVSDARGACGLRNGGRKSLRKGRGRGEGVRRVKWREGEEQRRGGGQRSRGNEPGGE